MACVHLTAVARPSAVVMAAPGFGKHSASGQRPRACDDFAHLGEREAYIASYIDRLPEGAAMDVKTLARQLPNYGQQAVRSALTALSHAGHLRRVRQTVGDGRTQWVFRTYFSRTARGNAWWSRFLAGAEPGDDSGDEPESEPEAPAEAAPERRPRRSRAYEALAALGRADERMALSAAECAELEALAAEWLARGRTHTGLVSALTAGLPPVVHSPAALVRTRLVARMPPELVLEGTEGEHKVIRIMECTNCGVPGPPEALPGGLCSRCRAGVFGRTTGGEPPVTDVHAKVEMLRIAARSARRRSA